MQIKSARIKSYRSWPVDETAISVVAKKRFEKIQMFDQLKAEGCCEKTALKAVQAKRSTLFLWKKTYRECGLKGLNPESTKPKTVRKPNWSKKLKSLILKLRKKHPYWGKEKIHRLLVREYKFAQASISTVGRIIKHLISLGKILPVAMVTGRKKPRKKRIFNNHAKRWKYGMKSKKPGELLQVDHMSIYSSGYSVKHFKAVCPTTKVMIAEVYRAASSSNAKRFLEKLKSELPFPIISIQVDGGSEFMKDFELACQELGIPLFVLPPRSPKYNGNVERANGSARDEFYAQYQGLFDLEHIRLELKKYQWMYNDYRPHQALDYLTPFEYSKLMFQIEAA